MSTPFILSLLLVIVAVLGARLLVPTLPSRRLARPVTVPDLLVAGIGLAGLALHCGSMFFPSLVAAVPGTGAAMREIDALGAASILWYVVPAMLVVVGLRRQHPVAVTAVGICLAAVGITMYDGGPLGTHLAAIFTFVAVLTSVASAVVLPPWRSGPALR